MYYMYSVSLVFFMTSNIFFDTKKPIRTLVQKGVGVAEVIIFLAKAV